MNRIEALQQLTHPDTWCNGAAWLAEASDRTALVPLMQAYEIPLEANRVCLLDAMHTLDAETEAHQLFAQGTNEEQRLALHLMELFPSPVHLPLLEQALSHGEVAIVQQALRSLRLQKQTPEWEALLFSLLNHGVVQVRAQAIQSLSRHLTPARRERFVQHLPRETDANLRAEMEAILQSE